ncbi:MAG TPA: transketolase [Marinilabiliales bacterium]|jgi:transketolase|nr:MAG: hypothetical protein A2W95_08570 [Bacteroidetes bacterium GWA2_40_14]OFX60214.1 MAG: hypothetical protein A2W84_07215 [Bacteroidetes bacterium GWC2_40_13]OFX75032.1 MAG: hypothetical protein A2W96_16080 [Bacteroidetes bacterium GWD2_40_43]OFX89632.1 MAG: hypothetical protein A2W97_12920 [Bacteroidetes bacterium GWE2_40_63]OFY24150.1 MAG: hypothetical protein A2W88_14355 [Bacteroidetes bacterium GWF2_40_13]OFZ26342.1 MAG: hypothetical protein A2437_03270 [Bacteroidetes bacterium RIFOXYC
MEKSLELSTIGLANKLRVNSLEMAYGTGNNGSHLGGGLSTIEIFATLYGSLVKYNTQDAFNPDRDRVIVSKGHCVLAYYSALNYVGFISGEELKTFEVNGSFLHGHATRDLSRGIEFSGGSLGMGLPYAVGVAIAGKKRNRNYHVYVIVGDGECNEGSVWESFMSASHNQLDNFTVIIDDNKLQYDGESEKVLNLGSLQNKLEAFGFSTHNIDGHNVAQLYDALTKKAQGKPNAIIANTVKGKGVSFMEHKKEWHHSRLTQEQFDLAISEQPVIKTISHA